jgi:4-azaleucine resistance transporter AzlC
METSIPDIDVAHRKRAQSMTTEGFDVMKNSSILRDAFLRTMPVLFGYVPIGIAFGFLLVKAGYPWYFAPLMSLLIYSGATQFLAIGFLLKGTSFPEIILTTFLLNLRHTFFGLSLLKKYGNLSFFKPYAIFALTDETYALVTGAEEPPAASKGAYYFFLSALNHSYWIAGSVIGALVGNAVTMSLKGLDFALTALFVVLTVEQYRSRRSIQPILVGLFCGLAALALAPAGSMLLFSILASTAVLLLGRHGVKDG